MLVNYFPNKVTPRAIDEPELFSSRSEEYFRRQSGKYTIYFGFSLYGGQTIGGVENTFCGINHMFVGFLHTSSKSIVGAGYFGSCCGSGVRERTE